MVVCVFFRRIKRVGTAKTPRKTREEGFPLPLKTWRSWRLGGSDFSSGVSEESRELEPPRRQGRQGKKGFLFL
jgi:hypothetical protein